MPGSLFVGPAPRRLANLLCGLVIVLLFWLVWMVFLILVGLGYLFLLGLVAFACFCLTLGVLGFGFMGLV